MPSFISAGTPITKRVAFNSGFLDFGSNRMVEVDSLNMTLEWTVLPLLVLNSIKPQDLVRHSQVVTLTGKIKSFPKEMEEVSWGSSTAGTPEEIDPLDGQPTFQSPTLTVFDRNGLEIQYQFIGAIFKSSKLGTSAENYAEWDFELNAKDIALV